MQITNSLNLPEAIVKAVTLREPRKGYLSATTLLKGVKEIILTQRHWDGLTDDAADRIWAIFGTAVHKVLEHEGATEFAEERLYTEVDGIKVSGQIDNYCMETGVITDYKTASIWKIKFNDFADWEKQGMIYAWLLTRNGFKVNKCRFIALLKDHSKSKTRHEADYPKSPVYIHEFRITDDDLKYIQDFIIGKVFDYNKAIGLEDDEIIPCSKDERWAKPDIWAVHKEGRKTAIKLYDNPESAVAHASELGTGYYVEFRRGESVKCADYCSCNNFCNFYKQEVLNGK